MKKQFKLYSEQQAIITIEVSIPGTDGSLDSIDELIVSDRIYGDDIVTLSITTDEMRAKGQTDGTNFDLPLDLLQQLFDWLKKRGVVK